MENRAQEHHRERLAEALREEIETIIEGELADPRIGLATVTEVHLAGGRRSARVLVSVEGSNEEAEETLKGLEASAGYVRHELMERLQLRRAPELFFQIDRAAQFEARVDELLRRTKKKR